MQPVAAGVSTATSSRPANPGCSPWPRVWFYVPVMRRPAWYRLCTLIGMLALTAAREQGGRMAFSLSSVAFKEGAAIPIRHTCDGDDPDAPAGTWVHWVLYDLPAATSQLPENVAKSDAPAGLSGALQGRNDFRRSGYGGPCPPPGPAHRYFFKLYALDTPLKLPAGATKRDVEAAMQGHVLGTAQLMGTYARQKR